MLWKNKDKIMDDPEDEEMTKKYGSMYGPYEPPFWYFEIIEMMRKLVLTAGLVLVKPGSTAQILLGILVCFFYCVAQMNLKPLLEDNDDYLSQAASVQLFLTLLTGLVLKIDVSSEGAYEQAMTGFLLILMNVIIMSMGVGVMVKTWLDEQVEKLEKYKEKAGLFAKIFGACYGRFHKPAEKHAETASHHWHDANGNLMKRFSELDVDNDGKISEWEYEQGMKYKTTEDGGWGMKVK
jgi:hypothetical protein